MNQLFTAFGIDWHLLLIQLINFGILLAALSYFLYKPITRMIDERREKIAEGVRAYEGAAQRLADAQTERDSIIGSAAKDAESIAASARARAEEKGSGIVSAAQEKADAIMKDAAVRAEESKRLAVSESQKEIARAAMLAAEKILKTSH